MMMMRHRWQAPSDIAAMRERMGGEDGHPSDIAYVKIAVVLAVLTAIEVWVYYIDALEDVLVPILFVLMASKFALVAGWFMHLRFDNALFTGMFTGGLALALAVFLVVLSVEHVIFS